MLRRVMFGLVCAISLFGQGTVIGKVTNPDGGPVPTASLQFKNAATGTVLQAVAQADGTYALAGIPFGTYTLTIPTIGFTFKRFERTDIVISAGDPQRLDISLPWGGNLGTPGDDIAILVRSRSPAPAGPVPRTPDGKPDFTGVWLGLPGTSEQPSFLPWAEKIVGERAANNAIEHPSSFCLPGDPILKDPFLYKIVQTPTLIVILWEGNFPGVTQVFMDGRGHPSNWDPSWMGHSIGRWEGDTLVVDTVGYHDRSWIGIYPHTEQLHVVSRYHRTDLGHIEKNINYEDPGAFTKPWSTHVVWDLAPGEEVLELVCESNNYSQHIPR